MARTKKKEVVEVAEVVAEPVQEVIAPAPKVVTLQDATFISVNGARPVKYPAGTYEVSDEIYTVLNNSGRI